MELIVQLLGCIEIIVFAWGIAKMKFRKSKLRMIIGAVAIVFYGIMYSRIQQLRCCHAMRSKILSLPCQVKSNACFAAVA